VAEDVRGDKIAQVVRSGRPDKGMPPFNLADADLAAIVAFIHDAKSKSESLEGSRRTVEVADLQTGNADAGKQYFNGAGGCAKCHSPTGDFAGLATRLQGLQFDAADAVSERRPRPIQRTGVRTEGHRHAPVWRNRHRPPHVSRRVRDWHGRSGGLAPIVADQPGEVHG
jgi:mono/diheme cytochrome c family protein